MESSEVWRRFCQIAGVVLVVLLCLYGVRCVVSAKFIGVDLFAQFLQGLLRYIVS